MTALDKQRVKRRASPGNVRSPKVLSSKLRDWEFTDRQQRDGYIYIYIYIYILVRNPKGLKLDTTWSI